MEYKVGDCFTYIRNGANIKQDKLAGGIPITRIETLSNDTFNRDKMGYAGIQNYEKYKSYLLQDGDILMSHINSARFLGRAVVYHKEGHEKIIHGMNLLLLKARLDIINPEYAVLVFKSEIFKRALQKIIKKSVNQASFAVSDLKKLKIEVPVLSEQEKIVEEFYKLNRILKSRTKELNTFDELVKARFVEMFGDPHHNSKSWKCSKLEDLTIISNNGLSRRGNDEDGEIVLRLVELQSGIIDYSNPNRIILTQKEKDKYLIKDKDFLFARVNGNPDNVGRCAVFREINEPVYFNDHIIRFRFDDTKINGDYLSSLLNCDFGKKEFAKKIKTSAGQYTISQDGIGSVIIPVPQLSLQLNFSNFINQVTKSKVAIQKSLDETQTLMDSLMQKYFG